MKKIEDVKDYEWAPRQGFPHDFTDLPRSTVMALNWADAMTKLFFFVFMLALLARFGLGPWA